MISLRNLNKPLMATSGMGGEAVGYAEAQGHLLDLYLNLFTRMYSRAIYFIKNQL